MNTPTEPNHEPPDVLLVLRPVRDPQARYGHAERDADYRLKILLKRMLRDLGFRCITCRDVKAESRPCNADDVQT